MILIDLVRDKEKCFREYVKMVPTTVTELFIVLRSKCLDIPIHLVLKNLFCT